MRKITRIIEKGFTFLSCLTIACVIGGVPLFSVYAAGLEVSVVGDNWALGTLGINDTRTSSNQWTVTGSSDGTVDIAVKVSDDHASPWTAGGADSGAGTFGLKTNVGAEINIIGTDTQWMNNAPTGDYPFDLWFKAPSSQTAPQQGEHNLTVTLTASDYSAYLTWLGSTYTGKDCTAVPISGTVYDTGSGTICRYDSEFGEVPPSWTQAANWQKYSPSTWGSADECGDYQSTGPSTFSNVLSAERSRGDYTSYDEGNCCIGGPALWHIYVLIDTNCAYYNVNSSTNTPTNRVEIGIY